MRYLIIGIKSFINFIISTIKHIFIGLITALTIIPKYIILGIQCLFDEDKQKELKMEKKIIPTIIISLSITTYLLSIFLLSRWYVQNERNKKFSDSITEISETLKEEEEKINKEYKVSNNGNYKYPDDLSFLNIDLTSYINKNKETVAWIQVNGTNISYPVVQHSNNNYYLNHDFYNRTTDIGWVFGDYRDNFDDFNNNTIIYAHNLINRTMFGQLPFILKKSWQSNKNYHYVKLSTKKNNTIWQVFSTYKVKPTTDYLQSKFNSEKTYENFLKNIKNRTSYKFNVDVTTQDKIITLSTCDDTGIYRVVLHAKLINTQNK